MPKSELAIAIEQVCDEKNIPYDSVIESIEAALSVAYRKEVGNKMLNVRTEFNPEDGSSLFFDVKTVVEDPEPEELEALKEQEELERDHPHKKEKVKPKPSDDEKVKSKDGDESAAEPTEEEEEEHRFNPKTDIGITDAEGIKKGAELGDEIITELPVPEGFGRVAAQTAKQVIIQKLREAERDTLFNEYKDRVGEIVNATVHRVEGSMVYMDLGQATAIMPPSQQIRSERYNIGDRYKVYLMSVEQGRRGPEIVASRSSSEMVAELFKMEVPEIESGSIEIKGVAREGGSRTKIAVLSLADNIDPIGSCVGQRGARVQTVMSELGGEKIDIIQYSEDAVKFIVHALSPAKIISVQLNEEEQTAEAFVAEDQLSLAIGKGGQNVRLAAKLSGWKIDVVREDGEEEEKAEESTDEEPEEGAEQKEADETAAEEKEEKKDEAQDPEGTAEEKEVEKKKEGAEKKPEEKAESKKATKATKTKKKKKE